MVEEAGSPYEDILEQLISESKARLDKFELRLSEANNLLMSQSIIYDINHTKYDIATMEKELDTYKRALAEVRYPTRGAGH